jgi:hypothetical protein
MTHRSTIAAAAAALLAAASLSAALAAASPSAVALHKSDLPAGYKLYSAKTVSNAQMATNTHVPKAQFDKHGRLSGFEEEFRGTSATKPTNVFANVYAYKTSAGAAWDYSQSVKHDLTQMHRTSAPKFGDASVGMTERIKSGSQTIDLFGIDFHRGAYDVTVGVAGLAGHVHMSDAAHYAQIVDHRI